jgi:hypothetical protein
MSQFCETSALRQKQPSQQSEFAVLLIGIIPTTYLYFLFSGVLAVSAQQMLTRRRHTKSVGSLPDILRVTLSAMFRTQNRWPQARTVSSNKNKLRG